VILRCEPGWPDGKQIGKYRRSLSDLNAVRRKGYFAESFEQTKMLLDANDLRQYLREASVRIGAGKFPKKGESEFAACVPPEVLNPW